MARKPDYAKALKSMRAIYIDAGKRDEYFLDIGAEAFRRELDKLKIADTSSSSSTRRTRRSSTATRRR